MRTMPVFDVIVERMWCAASSMSDAKNRRIRAETSFAFLSEIQKHGGKMAMCKEQIEVLQKAGDNWLLVEFHKQSKSSG